jgi:hypothetical protein
MTALVIHLGSPWRKMPDMPLPSVITELEADLLRDQAWRMSVDHPSADYRDGHAWFERQCDRIDGVWAASNTRIVEQELAQMRRDEPARWAMLQAEWN